MKRAVVISFNWETGKTMHTTYEGTGVHPKPQVWLLGAVTSGTTSPRKTAGLTSVTGTMKLGSSVASN